MIFFSPFSVFECKILILLEKPEWEPLQESQQKYYYDQFYFKMNSLPKKIA